MPIRLQFELAIQFVQPFLHTSRPTPVSPFTSRSQSPTIPIALINNTESVFFMESFPLGSTELRGENFRYADLAQRT